MLNNNNVFKFCHPPPNLALANMEVIIHEFTSSFIYFIQSGIRSKISKQGGIFKSLSSLKRNYPQTEPWALSERRQIKNTASLSRHKYNNIFYSGTEHRFGILQIYGNRVANSLSIARADRGEGYKPSVNALRPCTV